MPWTGNSGLPDTVRHLHINVTHRVRADHPISDGGDERRITDVHITRREDETAT